MTGLLEKIALNHHRLLKDMNKQTSVHLARARRWADAVRRGCIFFYDQQEVFIGHKNIDWRGTHIDHQEWPAQLNRFYLPAGTGRGHGSRGRGTTCPRWPGR
jgi:hypothetical protein